MFGQSMHEQFARGISTACDGVDLLCDLCLLMLRTGAKVVKSSKQRLHLRQTCAVIDDSLCTLLIRSMTVCMDRTPSARHDEQTDARSFPCPIQFWPQREHRSDPKNEEICAYHEKSGRRIAIGPSLLTMTFRPNFVTGQK